MTSLPPVSIFLPPLPDGEPHSHHHSHSRSRHHSRHRRSSAPETLFALSSCLLLGWALVPLASVGFFETRLLAVAAWFLVAVDCLLPRKTAPLPFFASWCALAVLLSLWCAFQFLPWPAGFPAFWRGDAAVFAQVAAHAGGRPSIAFVPYESFHLLLWWAALFALGCTAAHRLGSKTPARLLLAGIVLLAILEAAFGLFENPGESLRIRGTFANADAFGGLLAMSLPLTAALVLDRLSSRRGRNGMRRMAWGLAGTTAFLFQLAVLFFTGSRGAAASAFVALAVLLCWCWKAFPFRRKALLGGLLLLACLLPVFLVHAQRQNVWDRAFDADGLLDSGIATRQHIWETGLSLVRGFPFGTGPGGTARAMPIYQTAIHGRYRLDYAHNDTLQFLGDLGWPGGVLLLFGLVLLARQTLRAVRATSSPDSPPSIPWLRRGAALALLAALVHSQAEFNLSARPPLQIAFALLAGFLCAAPETTSRHRHGRSSRLSGSLLRLPVVLAAVAAAVLSVRAAVAYRAARAAAIALDLEPAADDSPLLLPSGRTLPIPPDDPDLDRAARWGAESPFVHEVLAAIPLSNHRMAVLGIARAQAAAQQSNEEDPGERDPESGEPSDISPSPELVAAATLALRPEEAEAVRAALPHADAALRLAPWSARAMTDRAWLRLRATALRVLRDPAEAAQAHADLDLAAALYPADAFALSSVCAALSAEEKNDANLPRILELAERAFTLNPGIAMASMDRWWRAGIPLLPLAKLDGIPVGVLRKLYARALASDSPGEADAILERIDILTRPDAPPPASFPLWTQRQRGAWERVRTNNRLWLLRERLRRDLLAGDWDAVASSSPVRAGARIQNLRAKLDPLAASPVLRRLRLREWNARNALPRYGRVEWALSECAAGQDPELFRPVWEEAIRHLPLPPEQAGRIPPRVAAAFPALARSSPTPPVTDSPAASSLDLPFLGERIVLDAIEIAPVDDTPDATDRILLSWRFCTPPFPSALALRVRVRDEAGRLILNRTQAFEKAFPAYYLGNPPPGSRFTASFPLPRLASYARTLEVALVDGKTRIPQDDLLASPVVSFAAIPRRTADGVRDAAVPPGAPPSENTDDNPHHPHKESAP